MNGRAHEDNGEQLWGLNFISHPWKYLLKFAREYAEQDDVKTKEHFLKI